MAGLFTGEALAWGLTGHRIVTEAAADRTPAPLDSFFHAWRERIADESLVPDTILKDRDPGEKIRHYINIEELEEEAFKTLPRTRAEAEKRYGKKRLEKAGLLPWTILDELGELERAFGAGDGVEIAARAGRLAHYVADAHQPLHLTKNYDGKETCNAGIHAAFETHMIERNAAAYRKSTGRVPGVVGPFEDPFEAVMVMMRESHPLAAEILKADRSALHALKDQGSDYYRALHKRAGPIAESRISAAADALASLWYTAWVSAGRPAAPTEEPPPATARPKAPFE